MIRAGLSILLATVAIVALTVTSTLSVSATLDHFMLYSVKVTRKTPKFLKFGPIILTDQFRAAAYDVVKPKRIALPADKNHEGRTDVDTHLIEYRIKQSRGTAKFQKRTNVRIVNQCDDLLLEVKKPLSLLVPTAKDRDNPIPAPDPAGHHVDHFICYQVALQKKLGDGTRLPKLRKGMQVDVEDQFETRRYDLKKITKLCNPVAKSGTPRFLSGRDKGALAPIDPAVIRNPDLHLVCYQAKLAKKNIPQSGCGAIDPSDKGTKIVPKQPKHTRLRALHVNNQFGPLQLDTGKAVEFCIPSDKHLLTPTPTPTPIVTTTATTSVTPTPTITPTATGPTVIATPIACANANAPQCGGDCPPGETCEWVVDDSVFSNDFCGCATNPPCSTVSLDFGFCFVDGNCPLGAECLVVLPAAGPQDCVCGLL